MTADLHPPGVAAGIRTAPIDPADAVAVEAAYEICRAALAHDLPDLPPPSYRRHVASFHTPWPGVDIRNRLAYVGDHPAGWLSLQLPVLDNVDNAVVVLGAEAAETLFPIHDPIGQTIQLGERHNYKVVGVTERRAPSAGFGGSLTAQDYNRDAYIPFATDRARFCSTLVSQPISSGARGTSLTSSARTQ